MPNNSSSSGSRSNEEPNTAPEPDRWYNLTLGPSFKEQLENSSRPRTPKFCTLRYESKPASIDKSQAGFLHKTDKKVTVEYHNNQAGKPKVIFEGGCAEYKENDAVLFFDGEIFRLEQLHRAVKRLRRVWPSGDSAAAATAATFVSPAVDAHTTPVSKEANMQSPSKGIACQIPENVVHVEQIGIGKSKTIDMERERSAENPPVSPHPTDTSTDPKNDKCEEQIDIFDDDELGTSNTGNVSEKGLRTGLDIDINLPHQAETDDEIADVDISDDEGDKGPNAAEALRAQVIAERGSERTSSSSSTSESESDSTGSESGSGSGSSSTESESSDGDSAISP